jgi:hypothetical protein
MTVLLSKCGGALALSAADDNGRVLVRLCAHDSSPSFGVGAASTAGDDDGRVYLITKSHVHVRAPFEGIVEQLGVSRCRVSSAGNDDGRVLLITKSHVHVRAPFVGLTRVNRR